MNNQLNVIPQIELRQPNVITEAKFSFDACQLDIYFYLLAQMRVNDPPEKEYEINVKEMERITDRAWNYQQLRKSTKELISKVIEYTLPNGDLVQTGLLASAHYVKGSGCIYVTVSKIIRPILLDLKEKYTSFQLYCALAMTSKFAKRLYLLCSEWKNNVVDDSNIAYSRQYHIDELKYMLELKDPKGKEPEQYERWSDFEKYVLKTAKEQINRYSDLQIDYRVQKIGRSYELIQFKIKKDNVRQLIIDFKETDIKEIAAQTNKIAQLINKYKLSQKQAQNAVRRIHPDVLNKILDNVDEAIKKGLVKSIAPYTITAIYNEVGVKI